ncbi:MAG: hypothetical protein KAT35_03300, partial [Candidatus Aenigmarchaeota archaeon]|nr:hypothetical protein [Candidatus Aenigmarchaeota archaeon]
MRLPGITYGRVQSLGREDVTAPIRVAAAENVADAAWAQAMNQGAESLDDIVEMQAQERTTKAMNAYNEAKLAWQADQTYYDENNIAATDNGNQRYGSGDEAARSAAGEFIGEDTRAQQYFDTAAEKANVQYGDAWHRKVVGWKRDEQIGEATKGIELATQMRDFNTADDIIESNRLQGVFTGAQAERARSVNDANRTNSRYTTAIDMTASPESDMSLRKRIGEEPKLTDAAKVKFEQMLDNSIIERYKGELRESMSITEEEIGLEAAVLTGDYIVHEMAKMTNEDEDGLTTTSRQRNIAAQREVWREWKMRLDKKTAATSRRASMDCAILNTCPPTTGKTTDQKRHDDYLATKLGWDLVGKREYQKNDIESGIILANDEQGHELRRVMQEDFARTGYVARTTRETLDAAMTSNDPEITRSGVKLLQQLSMVSPGGVVAKQAGIVEEYSDIIQAFDEDRAVTLIQKSKSLTPADMEFSGKVFEESKLKADDFGSLMKEEMAHVDGGFLWFDAQPSYKETFRLKVEDKAKKLMPLVGDDMGAAYKAAIKSVNNSYGVDQTIGKIVSNPFSTSLSYGEVDNGEWAHEIIREGIPSFNKGEMPESYDYAPVPDFNPISNPTYLVSWVNEDGEYTAAAAELRFEESAAGKAYFREANEREAEMARERQTRIER